MDTPINPIKNRRETRIKSAIPKETNSGEVASKVSSNLNQISLGRFNQKTDGRTKETRMLQYDSTNKSTTCADASSPTWPTQFKQQKTAKKQLKQEESQDAALSAVLAQNTPSLQIVSGDASSTQVVGGKFNSFHNIQKTKKYDRVLSLPA